MSYSPLKSTSPFPSVSNMSMTRCTRGFCWSSGKDINSSTLREPELSRSSFLNLFPSLLISSASTEAEQRETKLFSDRTDGIAGRHYLDKHFLTREFRPDVYLSGTHGRWTPVSYFPPVDAVSPEQQDQTYLLSCSCWPWLFTATGRSLHQFEWTWCYRTSWCRTLSPNTGSCDTSFNTNHSADNHESAGHWRSVELVEIFYPFKYPKTWRIMGDKSITKVISNKWNSKKLWCPYNTTKIW